ncbi:sulfur carrier protein ThiS [Tistlia consotensis]|nr:sulfur carrier protein ThiS [Tistlia consotensis]
MLAELKFLGNCYATAVNSEVVPRARRQEAALAEGDRIEILSPMQGG